MLKAKSGVQTGLGERIALAAQGLGALVVIALSVLDWTGLLSLPWFDAQAYRIILLAVAVVLLTSFVERLTVLRSIKTDLSLLRNSGHVGARYLTDSDSVLRQLQVLVDSASEKILALGAKSTAIAYLERISRKVTDGDVTYSRLLTGDHITHELHQHLLGLINLTLVNVGWNYSEKYGNLTVSEREVLLAIPTPHPNRFRGLKLVGPEQAGLFSEVFWEAFREGMNLNNPRSLEILCEECGSSTHRGEFELKEMLTKAEDAYCVPG